MPVATHQLKLLRKLLHHVPSARAGRALARIHPADIAEAVEGLSAGERRRVAAALFDSPRTSEIMRQLSPEALTDVLDAVSDSHLAQLLGGQPADSAAFVLGRLSPARRDAIVAELAPSLRDTIVRLWRYPPGTAGAVMTTDVFAMSASASTEEALERIRARDISRPAVFYVYVLDEAERLAGAVSLRQLIVVRPDTPLGELMAAPPVCARADDTEEAVAELVAKYDFLALPIVDDDDRLLGAVAVDDVIDVVQAQATKQFYQVAGLDEAERVFTPVLTTVRRRLGWTAVNLLTALTASAVVGAFRHSIGAMVVLAAYMPIVAGLGGNSGTQSLAVVVRALALHEVDRGHALRVIARQLGVGLLVGAAAGAATGAVAYAVEGSAALGAVLLLAMVANMAMGALAGAAVPFVLKLLRQDPALGSGILVTGLTDSFGFLAFLGLATLLLVRGSP